MQADGTLLIPGDVEVTPDQEAIDRDLEEARALATEIRRREAMKWDAKAVEAVIELMKESGTGLPAGDDEDGWKALRARVREAILTPYKARSKKLRGRSPRLPLSPGAGPLLSPPAAIEVAPPAPAEEAGPPDAGPVEPPEPPGPDPMDML